MALWAWNPTKDGAPPLEIIFELDKHKPFPTCNKDDAEILEYKVLPLTRARDFLKIITSFAGLIEPFNNPDLSLYYTLTRKRQRPSKESVPDVENNHWNRDNEPENVEKQKLGERTLYITAFDHRSVRHEFIPEVTKETLFTRQNRMRHSLMSDTFYLKWKLTPKLIPKATQYPATAIT